MAEEHEHKGAVDATVVDVDPEALPMESVIVGDKRRLLGRRLGIFAFAILILFFLVNGYIQAAKNGHDLNQARKDNHKLISIVKNQGDLIIQLQNAIRAQNKVLRENHIQVVPVPEGGSDTTTNHNTYIYPTPSPTPGTGPSPNPSHSPKPGHTPKPKPTKTPSPEPLDPVTETICELTGICPLTFYPYFIF